MYNEIIYRPIFNALVAIYNTAAFQDFGVAVIVLTIAIRVLLFPLTYKAGVSQIKLQRIQPKLKEIQDRYADDKMRLSNEMLSLYKEHGVNPLGGCLPILLQLPIFIALYSAFSGAFQPESLKALYSFVTNPGAIHTTAFGFLDLTKSSIVLALVAGALQYLQARFTMQMSAPQADDPAAMMSKQMLYFFPILLIVISYKLPVGLVIYFITSAAWSILEQRVIRFLYARS